jgi:hypothetical protein
MLERGGIVLGRGDAISGSQAARDRTEPPMKSLIAFFFSFIAVRSDGDAGALLLREH